MERKKIILPVFNSIFWLNYSFFFSFGKSWGNMGLHSCCTVCYPIQMVSQPLTSLDLSRNYPFPTHFLVNMLGEFGALLR